MSIVVAIVVAAVVVGLGYGWYRMSRSSDSTSHQERLPSNDVAGALTDESIGKGVRDLELGDIVSFVGTDYMIEGRVDYDQEGYRWSEFMLVDGSDVRWLCVEDDDMVEVTLWRAIDDLSLMPPFDETVDYEETTYRMFERGEARASQKGETGRKRQKKVEYWEFDGEGDSYLAVEKWGGEIEIFEGRDIDAEMLEIFPGDDV